jgi:hypothetical protein
MEEIVSFNPGSRWKSAVCDTEVVVVRPTTAEGALECGGAPVLPAGATRPAGGEPAADLAGGAELGKRYGDDEGGLEVLCTKAGAGTLAFAGKALALRGAKRLPSSD